MAHASGGAINMHLLSGGGQKRKRSNTRNQIVNLNLQIVQY